MINIKLDVYYFVANSWNPLNECELKLDGIITVKINTWNHTTMYKHCDLTEWKVKLPRNGSRTNYIYIYIYMCVCVCVCV